MKNIRKALSIIFIGILVICAAACSNGSGTDKAEKSEKPEEAVSGGWELNKDGEPAKLPEAVDKAFSKATEDLEGSDLKPAAYIGSQVVAGSNYMILCRSTSVTDDPVTKLQMAVVYADLEGGAKLTYLEDFDVTKYTEGEGAQESEMLAGGWFVPEDACGSDIPDEASAAYEKASESVDWKWSKVSPLAYLGSQVVAGTNYALLCKAEMSDGSPACILVVTVYEDLEGKAEITNICGLDLKEFSGQ